MNELSPLFAVTLGRFIIGLFSERPTPGPYVWIGNFRITLVAPGIPVFSKRPLGVYPTYDFFLAQKDAEIRSAEDLIRVQLSARNMTVETIELLSVDKLPVR